ncbi:MAG: HIRAN domain-containing protein [Proteobacteria bacterium]|nr:HIRAN domain-containing protein [Pseudomonadota bacterium]MBS0230122.1 HIRAN domain-containing protein [Pseudomonadota bacterium]
MTLIAAQARAFRVQEDAQRQPPPPPRRQLDARLRTQLAQVLAYAQAQDDWLLPIHRPLRVTVAGFQYGQGEDVLDDLQIGDVLRLVREPDNPHDQRAVRIEWNRKKLGYVPRAENAALAQALDRGAAASARVHALLDNDWAPVEIEIELEG